MAREIFRVDLSEAAADFQPTATEPGLPMLDSVGANDALLCRWVGDLVAEPDWRPDGSIAFFIRHNERGRLDDVVCRPATKDDLEGQLREHADRLGEGIRRARPESSNERLLHKIVRQTYDRLQSDPERHDAGCFLMKYRVGKDPWRLVWCWGYQRIDNRPALPIICRNPECQLLFVHRQGAKPLCPRCQSVVARKRRKGGAMAALRTGALALTALLLLAALVAYFFWPDDAGIAQSGADSGDGGRSSVGQNGDAGADSGGRGVFVGIPDRLWLTVDEVHEFELDPQVTSAATMRSTDLAVVEIDGLKRVLAMHPGTATVELAHGDLTHKVTVDVSSQMFTSLRIEPGGEPLALADDPSFTPHDPLDPIALGIPWGPIRVRPKKDGVVIKHVPEGSDYWDRGWREGMVITEVDGRRLPLDPFWYVDNPPDHGREIQWDPGRGVPQVTPTIPVRLTSWRPLNGTADAFVPELHLVVSESADYRVVGPDGTPMSDWQAGDPATELVITCDSTVARTTDGEYEMIVERRMPGNAIKQFHVPFTLKSH